jgi:arylsulfatase A-like enzyme
MKKLILIIIFMVAAVLNPKLFAQEGSAKKKNVLVIVIDDLGYNDLSIHGSKFYETPNIDKLTEAGTEFHNAYVAHPRCLPSRFAIQTGKFPAREQIPGKNNKLGTDDTSIGQAFKDNGYHTFFAGKWHLGHNPEDWPQNKGYDINKGGCAAGAPRSYFYPYNESKNKKVSGKHKEIVGLEDGKPGEYLTDRLTEETIKFINMDHGGKPFFAMLCHYGVHTPFQAPDTIIKKYKNKRKTMTFEGPEIILKDGETKTHQNNAVYAAMIETVDESLGKLMKVLEEKGLLDNTIVVFTSDHGGLSNRGVGNKRKLATSNLPLRAGKGHVYEGGTKVPFIIYDKDLTKKDCNEVTVNTDIYPTLLDLCGLSLLPEQHLDGVSMKPYLTENKELTDRTLFWHSPRARPHSTGDHNCTAVRVGKYKLIDYYDSGDLELYDLEKDPYETTNLAEKDKKLTKKLLKEINTWKKEINAIE